MIAMTKTAIKPSKRKARTLYKHAIKMLYRPITGVWIYTPVIMVYQLGLNKIINPSGISIGVIPPQVYGILYAIFFVGMLYAVRSEQEWVKKFVFSFGCGIYAMNAIDMFPRLPSFTWNTILALILFFEYSGGNEK